MVVLQLPKLAMRVRFPLPAPSLYLPLLLAAGCASAPIVMPAADRSQPLIPLLAGSTHQVQAGDTLWRLSHSFGLTVEALAGANQLAAGAPLAVGQALFIPLPPESAAFLWPAQGRPQREGTGLHVDAPEGAWVRAARSGRVVVATRRLDRWGPTVVLEHQDGTVTVYARLEHLAATPGAWIRQGMPIGQSGPDGVYFEIRHGIHAQDPASLLPHG